MSSNLVEILGIKEAIEQLHYGISDEQLNIFKPTKIFFDNEITYAIIIANQAIQNEYTVPEIIDIYTDLQIFAIQRIAQCPYAQKANSFLVDRDNIYQETLARLIGEGLRKADQEQLPLFVDLYIQLTKEELHEKNPAISDLLNNARQHFVSQYLDKSTAPEQSNFYFSRFRAVLDSIVESPYNSIFEELETPIRHYNAQKTMLTAIMKPMWDEICPEKNIKTIRQSSQINTLDLYEVMYNALRATEDTHAHETLNKIAGRFESFNAYRQVRPTLVGNLTKIINRRVSVLGLPNLDHYTALVDGVSPFD
jgi:hypothetical protein